MPTAGIVNDAAGVPEITTDVLVAANEEGGESNISTGWHAIEFLLWGQDLSADGAGQRPLTDYTTSPVAERRATYLSLLTQLLVDDLTFVRDQWDAEDGAYREEFLADPSQAVANIFRSMGALSQGELAGERIAVAYDTKDQEDEHSCFSDNTTVDIVGNTIGIRMIYTGEYDGVDGPSLSEAVAEVDPEADAALLEQLDANVALAEALEAPFDQLILGEDDAPGRVQLLEIITSLQDQGDCDRRAGRRPRLLDQPGDIATGAAVVAPGRDGRRHPAPARVQRRRRVVAPDRAAHRPGAGRPGW